VKAKKGKPAEGNFGRGFLRKDLVTVKRRAHEYRAYG